jgi:dCMP deaminase
VRSLPTGFMKLMDFDLENTDKHWIKKAEEASHYSCAEKRKVGAVAVFDDCILFTGINHSPRGIDCEDPQTGKTYPWVLHAEETLVKKSGYNLKGCNVYINYAPCGNCARQLFIAGVDRVVYKNDYKNNDGINYLTSVGIPVQKL